MTPGGKQAKRTSVGQTASVQIYEEAEYDCPLFLSTTTVPANTSAPSPPRAPALCLAWWRGGVLTMGKSGVARCGGLRRAAVGQGSGLPRRAALDLPPCKAESVVFRVRADRRHRPPPPPRSPRLLFVMRGVPAGARQTLCGGGFARIGLLRRVVCWLASRAAFWRTFWVGFLGGRTLRQPPRFPLPCSTAGGCRGR